MKKLLDWLLEAFMLVYEIFLYSLILPLTIGVIVLFIAPLANWFTELPGFALYFIAAGVGISIKVWRHYYGK